MKKGKIMLLSFALLVIVGAALAFKAKSPIELCYTDTIAGPNWCSYQGFRTTCPDLALSTSTNDPQFKFYCYTTPRDTNNDGVLECKTINGGGAVVNLTCLAQTTRLKPD